MKTKTKVRDRVKNGAQQLKKTTKKFNATLMEKVKIKRVKRIKKKATTGEKVLAAVGLGSTLLGGAGAVRAKPQTTQFVRTQTQEQSNKSQGIRNMLRDIFGLKRASASMTVEAAQAALTAAQQALSDFDAWVASATADIPKFAPEDQAQRQQDIDAEVARTRPGLVQAVSDAQEVYNQAVRAAQTNQGPQEGDTKTENGINYTFYQGNWVINNGQTKTEGGFVYGSQGGRWILLDGQTKTENGVNYISSGGQWVVNSNNTQAPKIGDVQTGSDGYQYVFSNSIYPTGAWTLVDGQTKTENGVIYVVQGGTWVQQQSNQPKEGDTKIENGRGFHFTGGQWVDNAGNRVQNPNTFWYIADGNGGWTLEDGQTKTENGVTYISSGGQWVVKTQTQTQTNQGPQENDTKVEDGKAYIFKNGEWVLQTPENIPHITYEAWRTDQGVGAYFNQEFGFVTLTTDGRLIDQNGNTINLSAQGLQNNYLLQGLLFQLHNADVNNTVKNPEYKPLTSLSGQDLLNQANNGTVNWNSLTAAQKQELANYFGNHPERLPQSVTPGSPLAYMLGLGTSADVNNPTVQQNAAVAGYEFKDGQWIKKNTTTATTTTTTTTTTTANQKDFSVVYGQGNLNYSVVDNNNGTFSVIYDGKILMTGSSQADIDAARAKYPFLYATPEAVILANLSLNFNNVFASSGGTIRVDTGIRPVVDVGTPREVWRDSQGNSAAYFGELGGRVYYDASSQKIFWEKSDGSVIDITNNPSIVSPQTSANIIKVLSAAPGTTGTNITITGYNDGKYPANYNLLTEMGVGVEKGPNHSPTTSTLTPGTYQQWWNLEGFTEAYQQNNRPFTVSVATDSSGQRVYTFTTSVNGQSVAKTFVGLDQLNTFLNKGFASADAYLAMSPQDQAIFNAAINARLVYPEIGLGSRLPVPGTNHSQTITYQDSTGRWITVTNGYNPTQLSFMEEAQYFQKLFPGSKIIDGGWAGVGFPGLVVNVDPNDPRRNFVLELPDGTQMNVGLIRQAMYTSSGVTYLGGIPEDAYQYFKEPSDGSIRLPSQTANNYTASVTSTISTPANTGSISNTAQQASVLPSITKLSSTNLKAGDTIQITGQNITQGTTLAELVNKQGGVIGLTIVNSSATSMTVKLPQYGLESGQYTLQLRFVGVGNNFGKVSNGIQVNVTGSSQSATTTVNTTGQASTTTNPAAVTTDSSGVIFTHVTVFNSNNANTFGQVSPGYVIEIGGQGLSVYDKFSLVVNGQEYQVKKFVVGDSVIKLTVPDSLPATTPVGSAVSIKLSSSLAGVAARQLQQGLVYVQPGTTTTGVATNYAQYVNNLQTFVGQASVQSGGDIGTVPVIDYNNPSTVTADITQSSQNAEYEATQDEGEAQTTGQGEQTQNPDLEYEAASDEASTEVTQSTNNTTSDSDKVEAVADEPATGNGAVVTLSAGGGGSSTVTSFSNAAGSQGGGVSQNSSGGGTANGLRGGGATISTLGGPDQTWTGGLRMPPGYPASEGLKMPENYVAASDTSSETQQAVVYKVKKGDTLWGIAKKYYGDGRKWRKIFEANLKKVRDPKQLRVGTELVIPQA